VLVLGHDIDALLGRSLGGILGGGGSGFHAALAVVGLRECMVRAWMGKESTLGLCAVVILAVVLSPGRSSLEGESRVTTTLKSLASSVPVVDCEVATPVERSRAWSPASVTWPLKTLPAGRPR